MSTVLRSDTVGFTAEAFQARSAEYDLDLTAGGQNLLCLGWLALLCSQAGSYCDGCPPVWLADKTLWHLLLSLHGADMPLTHGRHRTAREALEGSR